MSSISSRKYSQSVSGSGPEKVRPAAVLRRWEDLPDFMRIPEVRPYYESLQEKRVQLVLKRVFDIAAALVLLLVLCVPMLLTAAWIRLDSPGSPMFRQERATVYGKRFRIHKFRTMTANADCAGSLLTVRRDPRITRAGRLLRRHHLDELPQLLDVLAGNMSFVGTRAEVIPIVEQYRPEYYATLLLPAGITSEASIRYKDEYRLLTDAEDADRVYLEKILPAKMRWNLASVRSYRFPRDLTTLVRTVRSVFGKEY